MKLYLDNQNRITAVNSTDRTDLHMIELDETAPDYPFTGWSVVRICCYKIGYTTEVVSEETDADGNVISQVLKYHINMLTPYVPTHMLSAIEQLEKENKVQSEAILTTDEAAIELYEKSIAQEEINLIQDESLIEIYEMIGGV